MPIPEDHLRRLSENLSGQENWLRTLRRHIAGLEDEATAHETILTLARDRHLMRVLDELHDQPELFEQVARDPRGFFEQRGVRVPPDATVAVDFAPERYVIEARFTATTISYSVGWSTLAGFYAKTQQVEATGEDAQP